MPMPHEHDTLVVTNIDVDCHDIQQYTVEKAVPAQPLAGENNPLNIPRLYETQQVLNEFNHAEFFEVRYNGQAFRIKPGESDEWPRYIAEHYAKHLADHLLTRMEEAEAKRALAENRSPKTGFVSSSVERPKVLMQILQVKSWINKDVEGAPQQQTDLSGAQDIGAVPNYAVGNLQAQPKTAEEILAETSPEPPHIADKDGVGAPDNVAVEPNLGTPVATPSAVETAPSEPDTTEATKPQLIREAVQLGIEVNGRESIDDLKDKIRAFAVPR